MKLFFDFLFGFLTCAFAVLGFSGIRNFFSRAKAKKISKKVLKSYEKIDNSPDNRSDLDVLRKL